MIPAGAIPLGPIEHSPIRKLRDLMISQLADKWYDKHYHKPKKKGNRI